MWNILKKLFQEDDVHRVKNKYNADMMRIHAKAKTQVRESQEMVIMIENSTAYKIAKATGRLRK